METCYNFKWSKSADFVQTSLGHENKCVSAWSSLNLVAFTNEKVSPNGRFYSLCSITLIE